MMGGKSTRKKMELVNLGNWQLKLVTCMKKMIIMIMKKRRVMKTINYLGTIGHGEILVDPGETLAVHGKSIEDPGASIHSNDLNCNNP